MSDACPECGHSHDYQEVTLADLIDTLRRRRRIFAAVFVAVLAGATLVTLLDAPVYESTAILLPTNERAELIALVNSPAFSARVFEATGNELEVAAVELTGGAEILVRFHGRGAPIQLAADQAMVVLGQAQDTLREVTWSKNWQAYYEAAGKNEAAATASLQALVDGMTYYEVLGEPSPGIKIQPNVQLNLALGIVLGGMMAVFSVFGAEWWANYRARNSAASP